MCTKFRIAIISGKLGDVDGVSLEVDKWIEILGKLGHEIFCIAGKFTNQVKNVPADNQIQLEKIRFDSQEQKYFENLVFPHLSEKTTFLSESRHKQVLEELTFSGDEVAGQLYEIIKENNIDVIIGQNTNAMPMSLLGGLGIYQIATKMRVATIFHHHDFWWERSRFSHNYIEGLLNKIMPPTDLGIEHVVISSYAAHILSSIKRVTPTVVYNCEDFNNAPERDDYNSDFRKELGFSEDDLLIVQPTRIVPRKRIEDSVSLVAAYVKKYPEYKDKAQFIISLYQGDELDSSYIDRIKKQADDAGVKLHLISNRVNSVRKTDEKGRKIYTNRDVLVNADIVTYLPIWEGFGNALLEAIAARVPVVTTTYLVYKTDIKGSGFRNIEVKDDYDEQGRLVIADKVLEDMQYILKHPDLRNEIVEHNFEIGKRDFGFETLERKLKGVMDQYEHEILASRKRLQKSKASFFV